MSKELEPQALTSEYLARIEDHLRCQLIGRVRDLQLVVSDHGLVLRGRVHTYYAKQLAQHAVMETTKLGIWANEIVVSEPTNRTPDLLGLARQERTMNRAASLVTRRPEGRVVDEC
jgi:hypothetical protein